MKCPSCNRDREDYARIRIEIVDKKSREILEVAFGEILCVECIQKRYKSRDRLRIYV
jgi:hypothetical protein